MCGGGGELGSRYAECTEMSWGRRERQRNGEREKKERERDRERDRDRDRERESWVVWVAGWRSRVPTAQAFNL